MNATVTLPIGDLDKLRDDLKENQERVKFYEKNEKVVKLQVREHSFGEELVHGRYDRYGRGYGSYYKTVDKYVEKDPEYVNFEDVKAELKKEAESNVIVKIGELERQLLTEKKKLEDCKTESVKKLEDLTKLGKENSEKFKKESADKIEALEKEIKRLNGDIVDLGKDEQIKDLTKQIADLKNRSFLERLFNL